MLRPPPSSTRTDTLVPYTALVRSALTHRGADAVHRGIAAADYDDMLVLGIEAAIVERGNVVAKALAVRRDQIVERSDHAFRRVAGDVDLARLVHARRDQEIGRAHV